MTSAPSAASSPINPIRRRPNNRHVQEAGGANSPAVKPSSCALTPHAAESNQRVSRRFSPHTLQERTMVGTKVCVAAIAAVTLPLLSASAGAAMPSAATGMRAAVESIGDVESVQYVLGGRRYCWYETGWHGPGWYRCGFELQYGY